MNVKGPSDGTLVARARRGDAAAFGALVQRHYRACNAVALAILRRRADAEDACQDAWVRALEKLDTCRNPERFASWMLQIVRNHARNLWAARRVRAAEPLDSNAGLAAAVGREDPTRDHERERLRARLEGALAEVSEVQRTVLLLHDLDGWPHRKIATALEISEVMSRQHLFQARRKLRAMLGDETLQQPE
ncbi:MAG: sigma-70 family RNA polymerase sigma factor [Candidatus Eisenbacteria bacterium]|nr:sigma-70 family RNA polymerase sigma factor [Candidatus Eisenbacteria bacterium]